MSPRNQSPFWKRFLPPKEEMLLVFKSFSKKERIIFYFILAGFVAATLYALSALNAYVSLEVPSYGGEFTEGIVGTPRFVNPVLALSDADRDLTQLVYAGLMKKESDGKLVPELAESYTVSPDGLSYVFTLKENAYFQDGTPVTTDDIEFTVSRVKDPLLKSPRRPNWEGVTVQKVNDRTVKFMLKQKYFLFLENTTLGILPKHPWKDLPPEQFSFSDFNTAGVGAGPYQITKVTRNSSGIPDYYELSSFNNYVLGRPYIDRVIMRFYPNQTELVTAFDNGIVDNAASVDAKQASFLKESGYRVETTPLPRVFGVFFNQNQNQIFADKAVREALSRVVDKDRIINAVLFGYGTAIDGPLPGLGVAEREEGDRVAAAKKILENAGWKWNDTEKVYEKKNRKETVKLAFSLSTGDVEELKETAKLLQDDFGKLGARVDLKVFDVGDLNQNVIRPRKYDALLFGEIVGFDADPLPFWHSSQRNDPGLNIALYTNARADKILEELRGILDPATRKEKYRTFEKEIDNDTPAIFMYAPDFIYLVGDSLQGIRLGNVTVPSDRFLGIKDWYLHADRVWKPLTRFSRN